MIPRSSVESAAMMTREEGFPKLRFAREFSEHDALEAQDRGYLNHVFAELDRGRLYPLFFYDAVRLQQDLEELSKQGRPFIADPGMIVVQAITPETMRQIVHQLSREGFFDALVPFAEDDLSSGYPYDWPLRRSSGLESRNGLEVETVTPLISHI
jgi:hypothetical protein